MARGATARTGTRQDTEPVPQHHDMRRARTRLRIRRKRTPVLMNGQPVWLAVILMERPYVLVSDRIRPYIGPLLAMYRSRPVAHQVDTLASTAAETARRSLVSCE